MLQQLISELKADCQHPQPDDDDDLINLMDETLVIPTNQESNIADETQAIVSYDSENVDQPDGVTMRDSIVTEDSHDHLCTDDPSDDERDGSLPVTHSSDDGGNESALEDDVDNDNANIECDFSKCPNHD